MKQKLFIKIPKETITWCIVFFTLYVFIEVFAKYRLFYMEQWQTFYYNSLFVKTVMFRPGGIACLIGDFLIQFFCIPYCGALIMALMFTLIILIIGKLVRHIAPQHPLYGLGIIPAMAQLFLQLDNVKYHLAGSIALLFVVAFVYGTINIKNPKKQLFVSSLLSVALFLLCGAATTLFSIIILVCGATMYTKRFYLYLIPVSLSFISATIALKNGYAGEYGMLLSQDAYYSCSTHSLLFAHLSWILLTLILWICLICRKTRITGKKSFVYLQIIQIAIIIIPTYYIGRLSYNPHQELFYHYAYYMRMQKWDDIIKLSMNKEPDNCIDQICINTALAEKGMLAEKLFNYPQKGIECIYIAREASSPYEAMIISEEFFSMGYIAASRRWAFEANEGMDNNSPYCFQQLARTNIIFGDYDVADKYISLLKSTIFYRDWADTQSRYLHNDNAVSHNKLLGIKRSCIHTKDDMMFDYDITADLKQIIDHNPRHTATIQYLGTIYLLSHDMTGFKNMIDRYYRTRALPTLPQTFQEAIVLIASGNTAMLKHYNISKKIINEYNAYQQQNNL
ncbi:MAG: hypothetical protein KA955_07625 [Prevotella sp.]|jgi:hypothetical protein|nr:hypothetical protein [Prevotella sp.]